MAAFAFVTGDDRPTLDVGEWDAESWFCVGWRSCDYDCHLTMLFNHIPVFCINIIYIIYIYYHCHIWSLINIVLSLAAMYIYVLHQYFFVMISTYLNHDVLTAVTSLIVLPTGCSSSAVILFHHGYRCTMGHHITTCRSELTMVTIWLWLTVCHGKSPFLIGKPSISMGHLYHGYVK